MICRRQNKYGSKIENCLGKGRKHCGKRRKCWLSAFSSFPTMFSKGFLYSVVKSRDCVVELNYFLKMNLLYLSSVLVTDTTEVDMSSSETLLFWYNSFHPQEDMGSTCLSSGTPGIHTYLVKLTNRIIYLIRKHIWGPF